MDTPNRYHMEYKIEKQNDKKQNSMKKYLALLLMAVVVLNSCTKEDIDDIRKRLTLLEEWQSSINSEISTLQSIVSAIEGRD